MTERMAALPPDIIQLNKRAVHRQMDAMGFHAGVRESTEFCTLTTRTGEK